MRNIITVALVAFAISLIPSTKARSAENVLLGAFNQPGVSQLMLTALAEPGSPQVGKTVQVTDDLRFAIGYRLWLNYWQTNIFKVSRTIVDPDEDAGCPNNLCVINVRGSSPTINQFAAASIPTVGVRYKDFFASASVMITPDYNFPTATEIVAVTPPNGSHTFQVNHKVTGSRIETDINGGYYIHPWIALTMGYKGVFQKFKDKAKTFDITSDLPSATITSKSNVNYNGGTIGIAANVPIPEAGWIPGGFSLYGNGGGGPSASSDFKIAWYGTLDGGLAYKPSSWPLLFTIGYKFQIINSLTKSDAPTNHIIDYTRGAILGMNFVF